ncbi:hypothetical protein BCY86_02410 [Pajaroellobacter abortibovis]|uniref:Uncharacterized protein n=1 Tax=Pajaroellobacter abortibovis TaxID=1882918 RepID=A0A1L6MVT1_9BACT|nr:hypothetical protein BCY86_02410 [Pajaroellobacter abortibovis]
MLVYEERLDIHIDEELRVVLTLELIGCAWIYLEYAGWGRRIYRRFLFFLELRWFVGFCWRLETESWSEFEELKGSARRLVGAWVFSSVLDGVDIAFHHFEAGISLFAIT